MPRPRKYGSFQPVPVTAIPGIQRTGRPGVVRNLQVYKDFQNIIDNNVPFEALIFDTDSIKPKSQGGPLKTPKATIMSTFRKELRARKLNKKYSLFLRGALLYFADQSKLSKVA